MIITCVYGANTTKLQTITVYTTFYLTLKIAALWPVRGWLRTGSLHYLKSMLMARAFLLLVLLIVQQEQLSPYKVTCGPQPRPLGPVIKPGDKGGRRSAVDVCSNFTTASTPYSFVFPRGFYHLPRPWIDNPTATTGTSATVTQGMNHLFSLRVPGLGGQTVADVVDELEREGCLSFPWGESVRDLFFGELL